MKKKSSKPLVTILIPSVNEDKIIKKIVRDCYAIKDIHCEVLVIVDSKSTKQTIKEARKSRARVINIGAGKGKGSAIKRSLPYIHGVYTVQIDADYQFMPFEIPKLLTPLDMGYDVALGTRYEKGSHVEIGSVSLIKKMGSFILSLTTSFFVQQRVTDVMAGFKAFKTHVLKDLDPKVDHFGYEAELVIQAAKKKYKILNVPITYKKRTEGISTVSSLKHGLLVLQTIITVGMSK